MKIWSSLKFSNIENIKTGYILAFVLFLAILFRSSTLFVDYYDVDELASLVQDKQFYSGHVIDEDYTLNKKPAFHIPFKIGLYFSLEQGWRIVHFLTILIVFLTSIFIYFTGVQLRDKRTGFLAAVLYSVLISSFNRYFMATNGEIIFNLPVASSIFFLIKTQHAASIRQKVLYGILSVLTAVAAYSIKFQGIVISITLLFFSLVYYPYYLGLLKKYYGYLLAFMGMILLVLCADYFTINIYTGYLINDILSKINYSTAQYGIDFTGIAVKIAHRQGLLFIWHFVLWFPVFYLLIDVFAKRKFKSEKISFYPVFILFVFSYILVFGGGKRIYFHYFMACYPAASILAAYSILTYNNKVILNIKKHVKVYVMVPALFFLTWNTKDVIIKYHYPDIFIHEPKILTNLRLVLLGTNKDYLMPDYVYNDLIAYIKKTTKPSDRIFVWGDGAYIYYFAERFSAINTLWPRNSMISITDAYKNKNALSVKASENYYLDSFNRKKPVLIIDSSRALTSSFNSMSQFEYPISSGIMEYIKLNYNSEARIDNFIIYRRKNDNKQK
jgi:hypothetical protein